MPPQKLNASVTQKIKPQIHQVYKVLETFFNLSLCAQESMSSALGKEASGARN